MSVNHRLILSKKIVMFAKKKPKSFEFCEFWYKNMIKTRRLTLIM